MEDNRINVILKENTKTKETIVHPAVEIFEEAMEMIKTGNVEEIFDLDEEAKGSLTLFEEAIKKIRYKVTGIKEEGDTVNLKANLKVPDLSKVRSKLYEKIEKYHAKLLEKSDDEVEKTTLKWLKETIFEELSSKEVKYNMEDINIKYRKNGDTWEVEDDTELVRIFNFKTSINGDRADATLASYHQTPHRKSQVFHHLKVEIQAELTY